MAVCAVVPDDEQAGPDECRAQEGGELPSRKLVDAAAIAASVPSSALGSVVRMRTPASPTTEPIAAQRVERVFMVSLVEGVQPDPVVGARRMTSRR